MRRNSVACSLLCLAFSLSPGLSASQPEVLDLVTLSAPSGLKVLNQFSATPGGADGVLKTWHVAVPAFKRAVYFSGDSSKGGMAKWPADANRIEPWVAKGNFKDLFHPGYLQDAAVGRASRYAMLALLQLANGENLLLWPVAGPKSMSWLEVNEAGELLLQLGNFGTAPVSADIPLLAWSRTPDVYAAFREAWGVVLKDSQLRGRTGWRSEKIYPTPFEYLGWCSWEEYKKNISAPLLLEAIEGIQASGLPIRWVLVDDGHQSAKGKNSMTSFVPDRQKFPTGWAPVLARRQPGHIEWMGVWHAFQGLWGALAKENDFGPLNQQLIPDPSDKNALLPKDNPKAAAAFYEALIGSATRYGFDFVKIDNQSAMLRHYMGIANAAETCAIDSQALETACHDLQRPLINCMAHNSVCLFNTRYSAVTRCSVDYKMGDADKGKSHLRQSFHNTLWLGQSVWPDHDMFHSSDPHCGRMMAVSKALSGAPIYLSDAPKHFVRESIAPLCFQDGRVLRPLAPAVPLPDSVFVDAYNEPVAYRVIAPMANGAAAVVVYNLLQKGTGGPISGQVSSSDYPYASGLLQPSPGPWKIPAEGLVLFDWYEGKGEFLAKSYEFKLTGFSDKLLLLSPVKHGWAVIGRPDKFLSQAAIRGVETTAGELKLTMVESGPLVIWLAKGRPEVAGATFQAIGNGFWKADLPVGGRDQVLTISKR